MLFTRDVLAILETALSPRGLTSNNWAIVDLGHKM